jgi:hypothetical protein
MTGMNTFDPNDIPSTHRFIYRRVTIQHSIPFDPFCETGWLVRMMSQVSRATIYNTSDGT